MDIVYNAAPTISKFHSDNDFVRGLMGPIGSGKSVGCTNEMMRRACEQVPYEDGVRNTRWAIIRNTYRELVDTTMKTFFDWFPQQLGVFRQMDMMWTFKYPLGDGSLANAEFLFRALDRPNDVKKLLSLELTGAWINEAREVPKPVLDMLQGRVGRFPSKRNGPGPSWFGVIMDTNPPDSDHWWYKLFEEDMPDGFKLYKQPSGLSPLAENIENLPEGYYTRMMAGKNQEWIDVYVHGKYGFISDGKPVYPEYQDDIHHVDKAPPLYGKIYVGIDFGLTPAAVISQIAPDGQYQIIDELIGEDMGAKTFGYLLKQKLDAEYKNCEIEVYGDPAGDIRSQTDESTPFQVLWAQGINVWPAPTNDFIIRQGVLADRMLQLTFTGRPAFCIFPKAQVTRKSFAGGYKYKRLQITGEMRFQDVPDKNRYSHPGDAAQYGALGALGMDNVIGGFSNTKPDYSLTNRIII